jgi:ATP-dependent protease HslVU (ClpYQ) peptidase subunit
MTCIVGIEYNKTVYIGGDSCAAAGYDVHTRFDEKVFPNGPVLMGFTSSFRMGQILRYSFSPPVHKAGISNMSYLTNNFIDAIRKNFSKKGFIKTSKNNQEEGGTFLLGYKKKLYVVYDDFQVAEPMDGYAAAGSGSSVALGAMHALSYVEDPVARVLSALEAAAHFNAAVKAPFVVYCLDQNGKSKKVVVSG